MNIGFRRVGRNSFSQCRLGERTRRGKLGMELDLAAPEVFAQMVKSDWERYRTVVKASGFKPED